jgi:dienelactone hydrolase
MLRFIDKKYGRLKSRETAWRDIFLAEGYVVLLLDSFTERGHRSICRISLSNRPIEPNRERPHDAYGALQWLQSQPFIAPDKIVLGGWSNGAMSILWTVFADAPQRPKSLTHDFRAAFGFYPGCSTLREREQRYTAAVPTLLQLGTDDNWTLPEPCRELVETANTTGGAKITTESYEGAVHSFDHPTSKPRTISSSSGRRVRIGSDPSARHKAIERIRQFLRSVFTA